MTVRAGISMRSYPKLMRVSVVVCLSLLITISAAHIITLNYLEPQQLFPPEHVSFKPSRTSYRKASTTCNVLVLGGLTPPYSGPHAALTLAESGCHVTLVDDYTYVHAQNLHYKDRNVVLEVVSVVSSTFPSRFSFINMTSDEEYHDLDHDDEKQQAMKRTLKLVRELISRNQFHSVWRFFSSFTAASPSSISGQMTVVPECLLAQELQNTLSAGGVRSLIYVQPSALPTMGLACPPSPRSNSDYAASTTPASTKSIPLTNSTTNSPNTLHPNRPLNPDPKSTPLPNVLMSVLLTGTVAGVDPYIAHRVDLRLPHDKQTTPYEDENTIHVSDLATAALHVHRHYNKTLQSDIKSSRVQVYLVAPVRGAGNSLKPLEPLEHNTTHIADIGWTAVYKSIEHIKESLRIAPCSKVASTSSTKPKSPNHTQAHKLAVLITGQVQRFVYKDMFKHVPNPQGLQWISGMSSSCEDAVDVHIVLQVGYSGSKPFKWPWPQVPPYGRDAWDPVRIEMYFERQGAHRVSVGFVSGKSLIDIREALVAHLKQSANNGAAWWHRVKLAEGFSKRWPANPDMLQLRHIGYATVLQKERSLPYNYSHVLYLRDDNVFLRGIPEGHIKTLAQSIDAGPGARPSVVVDSRCGFRSLSDKIYLANKPGADLLWSPTSEQHVSKIRAWLEVDANHTGKHARQGLDIQTEQFLYKLLSKGTRQYPNPRIKKANFHRTDMRYAKRNWMTLLNLNTNTTPTTKSTQKHVPLQVLISARPSPATRTIPVNTPSIAFINTEITTATTAATNTTATPTSNTSTHISSSTSLQTSPSLTSNPLPPASLRTWAEIQSLGPKMRNKALDLLNTLIRTDSYDTRDVYACVPKVYIEKCLSSPALLDGIAVACT